MNEPKKMCSKKKERAKEKGQESFVPFLNFILLTDYLNKEF